jgi:hypothetical protein
MGSATRAGLAVAIAVAAAGMLDACNATKRELVVHFSSSATPAQHRTARDACAHAAPHVTAEPMVTSSFASAQANDVRFRIDEASDADIAKLENCLHNQVGVLGVSDTADMGG